LGAPPPNLRWPPAAGGYAPDPHPTCYSHAIYVLLLSTAQILDIVKITTYYLILERWLGSLSQACPSWFKPLVTPLSVVFNFFWFVVPSGDSQHQRPSQSCKSGGAIRIGLGFGPNFEKLSCRVRAQNTEYKRYTFFRFKSILCSLMQTIILPKVLTLLWLLYIPLSRCTYYFAQ